MTYQVLVSEIRDLFMQADVSGIKEHIAYQFNIRGEAEGAFYAEVSEGKLYIEPYEYFDRDVLFTTTAETLLGIAGGTMDAVAAFTQGNFFLWYFYVVTSSGNARNAALPAPQARNCSACPETL